MHSFYRLAWKLHELRCLFPDCRKTVCYCAVCLLTILHHKTCGLKRIQMLALHKQIHEVAASITCWIEACPASGGLINTERWAVGVVVKWAIGQKPVRSL